MLKRVVELPLDPGDCPNVDSNQIALAEDKARHTAMLPNAMEFQRIDEESRNPFKNARYTVHWIGGTMITQMAIAANTTGQPNLALLAVSVNRSYMLCSFLASARKATKWCVHPESIF